MRRRPSRVCPRCGYDQSGEIAQWGDRCPVRGRCVECGHDFEWADIFDPSRRDVAWSVEHADSLRDLLWRVPLTVGRMAWPPRFWRPIGVDARSLPMRLLVAAVVALLALWLLGVPIVAILAGKERIGAWQPAGLGEYLRSFSDAGWGFTGVGGDIVDGFVLPFGTLDRRATGVGGRAVTINWFAGWPGMTMLWLIPLGASLTWAIVLSALPVTRRLAQLRAAHLIRAVLGSVVGIAVGFGIGRIAMAGEVVGAPGDGPFLLVLGLTMLWVLVWWLAALRRGWGIRSPLLAVTGTVAAFLGGVTLFANVALMALMW